MCSILGSQSSNSVKNTEYIARSWSFNNVFNKLFLLCFKCNDNMRGAESAIWFVSDTVYFVLITECLSQWYLEEDGDHFWHYHYNCNLVQYRLNYGEDLLKSNKNDILVFFFITVHYRLFQYRTETFNILFIQFA